MGTSKRKENSNGLVKAAVAFFFVAALFTLYYRGQAKGRWRVTQGSIEEQRIAPNHPVETAWGSQVTWKAQYRVEYLVEGHEYSVWTDSGVRGDSEADVRLRLGKVSSCRVLYKPGQPETAVAKCE